MNVSYLNLARTESRIIAKITCGEIFKVISIEADDLHYSIH